MSAPVTSSPAVAAFAQATAMVRSPAALSSDAAASTGGGFAAVVQAAIAPVVRAQHESQRHIEMFNSGDEPEIHETMLALEKASIVFKLGLSYRDKAVEAFERCLQVGNG